MSKSKSKGLSYKDAGVDIDAGNELVKRIGPHAKRTARPGVLGGIGGFGGLFEVPGDRYKNPVLVSGTDGVGTKLRLALDLNIHDSIGIDLVAMCVNDIVVTGAEPLFFLDYFATASLDVDRAEAVVKGIADGCLLAGAALSGGETAEMPGMYSGEDYDLAGFCVGVVEKDEIIDGSKVQSGDKLLGLASSGPHSNGYSLIRKVIEVSGADLDQDLEGKKLGTALLEPTRIYVKPVLELIAQLDVHAVAHITGGGITENLPRVLPENCIAEVNPASWPQPAVFEWLANAGGISAAEMLKTFNCGIGMVIVLAENELQSARDLLVQHGIASWEIGEIVESADQSDARVSYRQAE